MTCRATIRMICEYLEGKLSSPVSAAIRGHLCTCRNCRIVHEEALRTLEAYFDSDVVRIPSRHHAKVA